MEHGNTAPGRLKNTSRNVAPSVARTPKASAQAAQTVGVGARAVEVVVANAPWHGANTDFQQWPALALSYT